MEKDNNMMLGILVFLLTISYCTGFTLTTSSDNATVGLDFTFSCVTTDTVMLFIRDVTTVCTITGSNTDGTCVFNGGYLTDYTYTCNTTTNTYTVTIPGSYVTESLHGTTWRCGNPFGGGTSNTKILYVNAYTLTTSSDKATVGLDFTFTCVTTRTSISFNKDGTTVCFITDINTDGTCVLDGSYNTDYTYTCNTTTNTYTVTIPGSYLTERLHGTTWRCGNPLGGGTSNTKILYVNVPVSSATLLSTPTDKNPVEVASNRDQTFSCRTNGARPSSRIQWYLSTTNITTSTTPQPDVCKTDCSDDKVISSSILTYTGNINDDGKILYCTAINIEGQEVVRSSEKTIVIWFQPRLNDDIPSSDNLIHLNIGMSLNLTVNLISNPTPTSRWILRRKGFIDQTLQPDSNSNGYKYTSTIYIQTVNSTQYGSYIVSATNDIGYFRTVISVIQPGQILASNCKDSNGLFAAGISGLVIGLLSIMFAVSLVVFCRFRLKKKDEMRSNNYTEFKTCTRRNPVVTDSYDSLETTAIGTTEVNENQTDRTNATYEEIMASENTSHTNQHQTKLPKDGIKKQEKIYDNMKA